MKYVYVVRYQEGEGYLPTKPIEIVNIVDGVGVRQAGNKRTVINRYELKENNYDLDYIDTEPDNNTIINKFSTNPGNKIFRTFHIFFTKEEADAFFKNITDRNNISTILGR